MSTADGLPADEMQSLLQFMYVCPVGLIAFDDAGQIERINPEAVSLLASSLGLVDFANIYDALGAQWPELRQLVCGYSGPAGPVVDSYRLRSEAPPSRPIWLSLAVHKVATDRNAMVVSDVTTAAETEEALRDSEGRLRALFNSIDEGYCLCEMIVDESGAPIDYRFLEVNPLFEAMTGLIDATGRTALELVPELEFEWIAAYARVALDGETLRFEQGSEVMGRWFDVFSMPVEPQGHFAIIFKDQTDQKSAVETLRRAADVAKFRVRLADALRAANNAVDAQTDAARLLGEFLGATRVHYTAIDDAGEHGVVIADYCADTFSVVGRHRLDTYGAAVMNEFRQGYQVVSDDIAHDERLTDAERDATLTLGIASLVLVPLVRGGRTRAALVVHDGEPRRWSGDELMLIEEAGERIHVAMARIRAEESSRIRRSRAELLAELLVELEAGRSVADQLEMLMKLLVPRVADYASIESPRQAAPVALAHRDPAMLDTLRSLRTDHRVELNDTHSTARAAAGEPHLISEITPALLARYDTDRRRVELLTKLAPRSHMAVPLDVGGGIASALMVGISDPLRRPYTTDDMEFLREIAQRVGVIVAATRLRQEEHNISVRLQQALLPDSVAWHPNLPIEARYRAADAFMEVGGDWYDTFSWPDGHIGIVIGDVVGHNLESAAAMGRLRAAAAALAMYVEPSPRVLLEALNRCARGANGTSFATAVCVVIEPNTGHLRYSSAGHPPVVVVEPDGTVTRLDGAQGLPFCALASGSRPEASLSLTPGALVVLYSDGLIERRSSPIDDRLAQLEDLVGTVAAYPLAVIADRLVADMTLTGDVEDDIVVVCCRFAPVESVLDRRFGADVDELAVIRSELRRWLTSHDLEYDDVLIAVGEACANAVQHAYGNEEAGEIELELAHHGYYLSVSVTDYGTWQRSRNERMYGGRGTSIMRSLATYFHRETGPHGTTLTMTLPAVRSESADCQPRVPAGVAGLEQAHLDTLAR